MEKMNTINIVKWSMNIGIPLAILLIPTNEAFTHDVRLFLCLTIFAIIVFAFETINQTAMAILLPLLYIIFKVSSPATVFSPWASASPWMFLGGLMLAVVLDRIGLLKRIAYKAILATGANYNGILYGLGLTGIILNIIIPAQAGIPMVTLAYGICRALDFKFSKEASGIMLTAVTAITAPTLVLFTGNYTMLAIMGEGITGPVTLGWMECLLKNIVTFLFLFVMIFIFTKLFKPEHEINSHAFFVDEYKKLGKISKLELKGLAVCLILLVGLLTSKYHGVAAGWVFGIVPVLLFLPGFNVGNSDDFKNMNYGFIFFVSTCMTIGAVASALGVGELASEALLPILAQQSKSGALISIWLICVVLNLLLTPLAIIAAFSVPLAQISMDLGINPNAVYFTMLHGMDQLILPYESAFYLMCFSFGIIHLKDFMVGMGIKLLVNLIFIMVVLLPFWRIIGFINA